MSRLLHLQSFLLFPGIEIQLQWLKGQESTSQIPRRELSSHNACLLILIWTFTVSKPSQPELTSPASLLAQELISAWMAPVNNCGEEIRCNESAHYAQLYHKRYHLLNNSSMERRRTWNGSHH